MNSFLAKRGLRHPAVSHSCEKAKHLAGLFSELLQREAFSKIYQEFIRKIYRVHGERVSRPLGHGQSGGSSRA
jgi:hypothetical protein